MNVQIEFAIMDSSLSPSICVFCLKETPSSLKSYDNTFKTFIKLFSRFVSAAKGKTTVDLNVNNLSCCDECSNIVNMFCDIYHEYKCLELQLDWMVSKIESQIRLANADFQSERLVQEFDSNQIEVPELVLHFREQILQKCQLKLKSSLPRLSLRRCSSPLPALFNPVFVTSSTESLNVTFDNKNEEDESIAEIANGNVIDEAMNCDEDFDTARNKAEEEDGTDKTSNVDPIEPSLKQDTASILNSTEVLPTTQTLTTDNVVSSSLIMCKTEPLIDDRIQTENYVNDNVLPNTSSVNTEIQAKEYNLRRKPPRNTTEKSDDDKDDHMIRKNIDLDNLSNISNSSFSETSSESSSGEEDELGSKSNNSSLNKIRKLRKKYKSKYEPFRVFQCKSEKCKRRFRIKQMFENHLKLHSKGKFNCKFCPKVKLNLVLLSSHELNVHGKVKDEMTTNEKRWSCPRCPFKSNYLSDYEAHFAYTHFGVGMEPLKRRVFEKCKICNRDVWNKYMDVHFKATHDTTTLGDKKIIRCKEDGCTAYFKSKWQLSSHNKLEHKTEMQSVSSTSNLKCHICLKTFFSPTTLRRHIRQLHKYQLKISTESTAQPQITNDKVTMKADTQQTVIESVIDKQYKCNFCSVVKENPPDLALHEAEKHTPALSSYSRKTKKPYRCPRCPYEYELQRAFIKHHLSSHLNICNPDSSTACKLCSGGKVYKANSEKHFRHFHKIEDGMEPHKCDKCAAYFRKSCQLQMHKIKIHEQDNECETCGKCFSTRISWKMHMRNIHPGNDENPALPLGCGFSGGCKKRFKTQPELDHHLKYGHQRPGWSGPPKKDGNKFNCEKCQIEFKSHTSLLTHSRMVHGDRQFVCEECGKAFGLSTVLDLHMEFHKRPEEWKWECGECGKKCATKQKLDEHGRTHTKDKPFICPFCGEKYAHRHNWRNHLKTKHLNEEGVEEIVAKRRKGNYAKRKGT